ncbi:glycosyltransferase family 39 protein [bacterium]|nr:glycosyltransferase family 39 protein [bacterium]
MKDKKYFNIVFFVILSIIALGLRLMYINDSLWYDEACSWFIAKGHIMSNLLHLDLQHTPLYFFLLHFWMKIFGTGELQMRILSLIFGLASIPLVYITTKKIFGHIQACFACAAVALSPLMIIFSVEVRMYSMAIFLVLLSLNYLIDFEQKNDKKSLIKLVLTDILLPYTFVGGILYNFSLVLCYGLYLCRNNRDKYIQYIKAAKIEWFCLIPYFCLIIYYAHIRKIFVVAHESELQFYHLLDVLKNFFAMSPDVNIYWPSNGVYTLTFVFAAFCVVPCVYFVYGLIQGLLNSEKFNKVLYKIFIINFLFAALVANFQVNVFTVRYILYLLPPFLILGIAGLFSRLSDKHCKAFLSIFIVGIAVFSFNNSINFSNLKTLAFKSVRLEADKLKLTSDDVVLMPFGSDAPYYFRDLTSPRVLEFDFHKLVRNPYNDAYYDKDQQEKMAGKQKYLTVHDSLLKDRVFSDAFYNYFGASVNASVPKGRYVLLVLYAEDAGSIVNIEELRKSVSGVKDVKDRFLEIMLKKFMCDTVAMLNLDFDFVKMYSNGGYTFLLYQKR